MYRFDESGWPVVEIEASGTTTVADVEEYFARWESWLSRREPLGVVLRYRGEEQGKPDKEARRLSNRWHKENRELTGRYCAGVAAVVESSKLVAVYKPIASTVMRKMMGCPGGLLHLRGGRSLDLRTPRLQVRGSGCPWSQGREHRTLNAIRFRVRAPPQDEKPGHLRQGT